MEDSSIVKIEIVSYHHDSAGLESLFVFYNCNWWFGLYCDITLG